VLLPRSFLLAESKKNQLPSPFFSYLQHNLAMELFYLYHYLYYFVDRLIYFIGPFYFQAGEVPADFVK
jgi:hypothetical protein